MTAVTTAQTPTGNWVKIQFLDGTQAWIDGQGVKRTTVNAVSNQQNVNKTVILNQFKRNDGLFMDGPYRTSAATMKPATQAKTLNGQSVSVITTATVANVSWDQIRLQDGKTYWIDARGLSMINLNAVSDQQTVDQNAVLSQTKRSDRLFADGPYKSSLTTLKPTASAKAHNGQAVKVVATAQSDGHQWSQITFNQSTYWIDSAGLSLINLYPVSDYQSVNRDAVLTQSKRNDGLFQAGPSTSLHQKWWHSAVHHVLFQWCE